MIHFSKPKGVEQLLDLTATININNLSIINSQILDKKHDYDNIMSSSVKINSLNPSNISRITFVHLRHIYELHTTANFMVNAICIVLLW